MRRASDEVYVVIDTETTGLETDRDELVEIAAVATTIDRVEAIWTSFVKPNRPIPPEVSAVHGLTDRDLADAPSLSEAIHGLVRFLGLFTQSGDPPCIAAHNAEFDQPFLARASGYFKLKPNGAYPWLCTKRLAMHVYPEAPNHRNQTLRYFHKLDVDTLGLPPHRALADALVTSALLRHELTAVDHYNLDDLPRSIEGGYASVDDVIAFAQSPILIQRWPFGKFYGEPISKADTGYFEWALGPRGPVDRIASDPDLKFTLERELRLRNTKGAA